jgi:alkylhydroperoxidase family enzyme
MGFLAGVAAAKIKSPFVTPEERALFRGSCLRMTTRRAEIDEEIAHLNKLARHLTDQQTLDGVKT